MPRITKSVKICLTDGIDFFIFVLINFVKFFFYVDNNPPTKTRFDKNFDPWLDSASTKAGGSEVDHEIEEACEREFEDA